MRVFCAAPCDGLVGLGATDRTHLTPCRSAPQRPSAAAPQRMSCAAFACPTRHQCDCAASACCHVSAAIAPLRGLLPSDSTCRAAPFRRYRGSLRRLLGLLELRGTFGPKLLGAGLHAVEPCCRCLSAATRPACLAYALALVVADEPRLIVSTHPKSSSTPSFQCPFVCAPMECAEWSPAEHALGALNGAPQFNAMQTEASSIRCRRPSRTTGSKAWSRATSR
jgi:hypothetical protein